MNTPGRTLGTTIGLVLVAAGLSSVSLAATAPVHAAPALCQGQTPTIVATKNTRTLVGTDGPDVISTAGYRSVRVDARGGDDLVCSTAWSNSTIEGGPGDDTLVDLAATRTNRADRATRLIGGPGADRLVGARKGGTVASYEDATAGVRIRLGKGRAVAEGDADLLTRIRSAIGSEYEDTFVGSDGNDDYESSASYAQTDGDVVRTGAGDDEVRVHRSWVDLGPGDDTASGEASRIRGGSGDDVIHLYLWGVARGDAGDDVLDHLVDLSTGSQPVPRTRLLGGPGNDVLSPVFAGGRYGDEDCPEVCARGRVDGGSGTDTLLLNRRAVVDLATRRARVVGGRSSLRSIENVTGSRYDDVIRGNRTRNRLLGGGGDDVLLGRGGPDVLVGGKGRDRAEGGPGRDRCEAEVRVSC